MMKKSIPAIAILTCLLAVIQVPSTLSSAQTPPAASPKGVASSLQPFVDNHVLAGAVTLVASKEKILSLEAVGYAEIAAKKPMRTDNLFWIASMTKPITATALMMLVDEGKVSVDDPVEKYLPEFKGQKLADGGRGGHGGAEEAYAPHYHQEFPHPHKRPLRRCRRGECRLCGVRSRTMPRHP